MAFDDPPMNDAKQQWDYLIVQVDDHGQVAQVTHGDTFEGYFALLLPELGRQGWEMVGILPFITPHEYATYGGVQWVSKTDFVNYYFKRPPLPDDAF